MNKERDTESRESRWSISEPTKDDPTLIRCPTCESKAVVFPYDETLVKAVCSSCGLVKTKSNITRGFHWHDETPTDGYFGFELWLQTDCAGHSLWVFNLRHLSLLESYVAAELRQRQPDEKWGWKNSSLTSRLPKWLKSAKNRDEILKGLMRLREFL